MQSGQERQFLIMANTLIGYGGPFLKQQGSNHPPYIDKSYLERDLKRELVSTFI